MRILVTGAAGQLGAVVVPRFRAGGHEVVACSRSELEITRLSDVMERARAVAPDAIVNCAAFNDVDGAEERQLDALEVNAFAVRSLARAARDVGAVLVHYGTDFVFDGRATQPYTEADRPNPQSVYASSKLLGEWFAADVPRHYVLRVESLFGGPAARSSIDRLLRALEQGREARAFHDRVVSPSYVEDVAAATMRLLEVDAAAGRYHCVNTGAATWLDVARELATLSGADPRLVKGVSVADVPLRAARPTYAALSSARLAAIGIVMPPWQDALRRYVAERARRAP